MKFAHADEPKAALPHSKRSRRWTTPCCKKFWRSLHPRPGLALFEGHSCHRTSYNRTASSKPLSIVSPRSA